ncbi:uncharacterized protein LOC125945172 isoform X1 [Dermacentor silvarum]|uniref:uncharacterized protein LOC125945172 isoform X1 n=1 Tax=Dermacentor silvarum TaxID=543639 RepID=UPI0021014ECE|nr:uncharacterized protein LOC125945172 isoform X1 [Dermacentor silvarum]
MPFDVPHVPQPAVRFPIRLRQTLVPSAEGFRATFFRQYASLKSRSALIAATLAIAENTVASVIQWCHEAARAALSGLSPRLVNTDTTAPCGGAIAKDQRARRSRPLEDGSPGVVPHKRRKTAGERWQGHERTENLGATASAALRMAAQPSELVEAISHLLSVSTRRAFSSVHAALDQLISFCNPGQGVDVADVQSLATQSIHVLAKVRIALELQLSYETNAFVRIGEMFLSYLDVTIFAHRIFSATAQTPEELRGVAEEHTLLRSWVSSTAPSSLLRGLSRDFHTLYRAWSLRRTLFSVSDLSASSSDDGMEADVLNPNGDAFKADD